MDQSNKVAQVAQRIRDMVHGGTLRAGDALPSTRSFATQLGIARGTVVAAYEQLDGEGYIRTRPGAIARVVSDVPLGIMTPAPIEVKPKPAEGTPVVDLRPGIPAVTAFPAREWRAAWRFAAVLPLRNTLSDPHGSIRLREQIAALGLARGFVPAPAQVIVAGGTAEALSVITEAFRTLRGRNPRFVIEDPGYRSGRLAILGAGGEVVGVPVTDDGLDLDALETLAHEHGIPDAVMVTPTHQYPLGSVMPVTNRRRLLQWAEVNGVIVIEDDYDSEFRHRGVPMPALASLDTAGVVIHLGSFSKILDPRLRCAYIVLPAGGEHDTPASGEEGDGSVGVRVAEAVRAARAARGPVVAEVTQEALAHLMRSGALRRHLGRVRRDYAHRRNHIATRLTGPAIPGLEIRALAGGLHAVLTWAPPDAVTEPGHVPDARAMRQRLARSGFLVEELANYATTPETALNGIVLGYGAVTLPELDRALDAILNDHAATLDTTALGG
ncbi:MAG: PLP-dependent aminotransferase family protein [Leifsonia sp.]